MKCIFIDDDYSVNRYHQIILEEIDEAVLTSVFYQDAREALEVLRTTSVEDFPQVIFLDLNMPFLDGWEFLDQYSKFKLPKTKIIILTTSENPNHKEKASTNQLVYDFISKPLEIELIYQLLDNNTLPNNTQQPS